MNDFRSLAASVSVSYVGFVPFIQAPNDGADLDGRAPTRQSKAHAGSRTRGPVRLRRFRNVLTRGAMKTPSKSSTRASKADPTATDSLRSHATDAVLPAALASADESDFEEEGDEAPVRAPAGKGATGRRTR